MARNIGTGKAYLEIKVHFFRGEQVDNRTAYQNVFYTGRNLNQAHVKHSHEGDTCTG